MLIDDPWFYLAAFPALVITGISKGGLGGGVGGVAVPLMALVISPTQAAAIMLPILCVMDLPALHAYFNRWDHRQMRVLLPAGALGIVIGTLTFRYLNDNWIRILLGAISLGALVYSVQRDDAPRPAPSATKGWFWCSLSGFTSFVAHAGGPPLSAYLLPQRLDKTVFVATSIIFFAAVNYLKIGPYVWLGLFDTRNLWTSAVLAPIGIASIYAGVWLHRRISQTLFYRLIYLLLGVIGVKLLYDGVSRL